MIRWCLVAAALAGACSEPEPTPPPAPGVLQVGMSRVAMPAPVGIGTVGFGYFGVESDPSPFSDLFPATNAVHGAPNFKAIVISRGDGFEAVFLRTDTVGVFQQMRQGVIVELRERLGKDLDHALIIGASHTHGGPGRVIDLQGPFELIADRFLPEHYERVVSAMADAVELAYADLRPARLGRAETSVPEAHNDRRCEDGLDYTNDSMPMLVVERDGQVDAVMFAYAVHGTTTNIAELTLTADVSGAIEERVEADFDRPVMAMMLNSWAADVAPSTPPIEQREGASFVPGNYRQQEAIAMVVSEAVHEAVGTAEWTETPDISLRTRRFSVDRELLGYAADVFPYDYGAVYCGLGNEADCDPSTDERESGIDELCVPFNETFPAPRQTLVTAGHIGDLHLITFPGEPGTLLAEQVMDTMRTAEGVEHIMFVGYGQDYMGYSILEDDWWQGGYEASGALWGPKQGEYFAVQAADAFLRAHLLSPGADRGWQPDRAEPFDPTGYVPYSPENPVEIGKIVDQVQPSYPSNGEVIFTVNGEDPWLGTPLAYLESADGAPVTTRGGRPLESTSYAFRIELSTTPGYAEELPASERAFHWTFRLPITRPVAGLVPDLIGRYRLRVVLAGGQEVVSDVFEVSP